MTNLHSNVTFSGKLQQIFLFIKLWDELPLASKQSKDRSNMKLSLCPLEWLRLICSPPCIIWQKNSNKVKSEAEKKKTGCS